jgi:GNAT superfamily N-acetyltransferase
MNAQPEPAAFALALYEGACESHQRRDWRNACHALAKALKSELLRTAAIPANDPAPTDKVYDDVFKQLTEGGVAQGPARHYAALWAAHYNAMAPRLGAADAFDAYQKGGMGLGSRLLSAIPVEEGGQRTLNQAPTLDSVRELAKSLGAELEVEPRGEDDIMLQWIKRAARKKGTGAQILQALIDHADATGRSITLGITDNKGARKLQDYYENFGFERDNPNDDYDRIMTRYPDSERSFNQSYDPGLEFRSAVHEAAMKGPNKASPAQWLATLANTPGVKKEELEWLGLPEFLKEQPGQVTKEDVARIESADKGADGRLCVIMPLRV